jgi:mercuric reductase
MQLVTVAALEGAIAAENALLGNRRKIDYSSIPHVIFTDPELASVGLTEKAAQEQGYDVDTRILDLEKVSRARIAFETEGLVKIVAERKSSRILGIHVLMPYGGEVIHKRLFW